VAIILVWWLVLLLKIVIPKYTVTLPFSALAGTGAARSVVSPMSR
jgi:hypothetical protein